MIEPGAIRAVLFDVVGTLLRLREPVGSTYARLAGSFGVHIPAARLEPAFKYVIRRMPPMVFPGTSPARTAELERAWWHDLVAATLCAVEEKLRFSSFEDYFDALFQHFAASDAWVELPGVRETLATLRTRGLRTGIVSNFDHRLHGILRGMGLSPLFDVVVLPADAGAAKPSARIFRLALERLGVAATQAVYVGDDATYDIEGARAAGLRAIDAVSLPVLPALIERSE